MTKLAFRSAEALALARELMPDYDAFMRAEELLWEHRSAHADLACRGMATSQSWEVETEAERQVEEIDPGHKARKIQYTYLLSAVDVVVDDNLPIRYRSKPPWGRVV